jgi:hypothetical protein
MIKKYDEFLILEKYDRYIKSKLMELGITDEKELKKQIDLAKTGYLATYLSEKGEKFTFGILHAIFKDAIRAKKLTNIKKGFYHILPSLLPLTLAPWYPIAAIIGSVFGASRMFHSIFDPIVDFLTPQSKYTDFLKRMIDHYMVIPEGEVKLKDRFTRAFVVSDRLVEAIKPQVLESFSKYLSDKMSLEEEDKEVPDNYIENELKSYLNKEFSINPEIPLKEK